MTVASGGERDRPESETKAGMWHVRSSASGQFMAENEPGSRKKSNSKPLLRTNLMTFVKDATSMQLASAAIHGLEYKSLTELTNALGATERFVSDLVQIKPTTLHRRKETGKLDKDESERVLRLARVVALARHVFDDENEVAMRWLKTPAPALGGAIPLECVETEFGAEEVRDLLFRIEYGVYS